MDDIPKRLKALVGHPVDNLIGPGWHSTGSFGCQLTAVESLQQAVQGGNVIDWRERPGESRSMYAP